MPTQYCILFLCDGQASLNISEFLWAFAGRKIRGQPTDSWWSIWNAASWDCRSPFFGQGLPHTDAGCGQRRGRCDCCSYAPCRVYVSHLHFSLKVFLNLLSQWHNCMPGIQTSLLWGCHNLSLLIGDSASLWEGTKGKEIICAVRWTEDLLLAIWDTRVWGLCWGVGFFFPLF